MNCIFCQIINNEIESNKVWENKDFIAILYIHPINPGHILLMPKSHVEDVFEMDEPLYTELFKTVKLLSGTLKHEISSLRIGVAIEGFGVPHVHVHLVPINHGNELNPEKAQAASSEELKDVQSKLQNSFKGL